MQRTAPLKRSGFARKAPVRAEAKQIGEGYTLRPRAVAVAVAGPSRAVVAVPKDRPLQHRAYMDAVRSLPCAICRKTTRSQFCHSDLLGVGGKGKSIKSDCRLGWPGCRDCHYMVGTSGVLSKAERHKLEADAGRETRAEIRHRGLWPADLAAWPGDET